MALPLEDIVTRLDNISNFDPQDSQAICLLQSAFVKKNYLSTRSLNGVYDNKTRAFTVRSIIHGGGYNNCDTQSVSGNWGYLLCTLSKGTPVESIYMDYCSDDNKSFTTKVICGYDTASASSRQPLPRQAMKNVDGIKVYEKASKQEQPRRKAETPRSPGKCLDASTARDPDIQRNLKTIRKEFCFTKEVFTEGRYRWEFQIFRSKRHPKGPFWGLPHDNESAAFDAAVFAAKKYGGGFLAIETREHRMFRNQDPNRNFGTTRAEARTCRGQIAAAPKFTKRFLRHFDPKYPILSMHNNSNGHRGNGGKGGISAKRRSRILHGLMSPHARGDLRDEDNLVFIAGYSPYKNNKKGQRTAKALHRLGMNVIYELVTKKSNDCSMSNYVLLRLPGRRYFNIEAEHGKRKTQKKMVDLLMSYLKIRPVR